MDSSVAVLYIPFTRIEMGGVTEGGNFKQCVSCSKHLAWMDFRNTICEEKKCKMCKTWLKEFTDDSTQQ